MPPPLEGCIVGTSSWINSFFHNHFREFSDQDYFDKNGLFISVVLSAPLLFIGFFIVVSFYLLELQGFIEKSPFCCAFIDQCSYCFRKSFNSCKAYWIDEKEWKERLVSLKKKNYCKYFYKFTFNWIKGRKNKNNSIL